MFSDESLYLSVDEAAQPVRHDLNDRPDETTPPLVQRLDRPDDVAVSQSQSVQDREASDPGGGVVEPRVRQEEVPDHEADHHPDQGLDQKRQEEVPPDVPDVLLLTLERVRQNRCHPDPPKLVQPEPVEDEVLHEARLRVLGRHQEVGHRPAEEQTHEHQRPPNQELDEGLPAPRLSFLLAVVVLTRRAGVLRRHARTLQGGVVELLARCVCGRHGGPFERRQSLGDIARSSFK